MDHTHLFSLSDKTGYEVCTECGTYHSTMLANPKDLYENDYWDEKHGHSYFGDQIGNLTLDFKDGQSKANKILSYIQKIGTLLEIGCAPGVVLNRARRKGHQVWGIEPDKKYIPDIILISGCEEERIINGYFPDVKLPNIKFDHIIAMDVVEHIEDYRRFVQAIYDNLAPNGKFIMMSPIIFKGKYRLRDMSIPLEHAWIFQFEYLRDYFIDMFRGVAFDQWTEGHEIFILNK